ncbi:hypothetical protein K443DRAFT_375969 [Laccaria amethystina LaAM-08-1]|uniref:Uncharacterized protein n=1 Tax=Laccaria amethystina LaAM-08-1 TaxID=1095629 RepID=A0A0C9WJ17_9AGAR|nr:hypothetical protein K443DRAFT_375969 [Laccaria amethystina LaAM-08-1]
MSPNARCVLQSLLTTSLDHDEPNEGHALKQQESVAIRLRQSWCGEKPGTTERLDHLRDFVEGYHDVGCHSSVRSSSSLLLSFLGRWAKRSRRPCI